MGAGVRVVCQNIIGDSKHECKVAAHPSPLFSKVDLLSRGLPPGVAEGEGEATVEGEKGWQMDRTSTLQSRSGAAREFKL